MTLKNKVAIVTGAGRGIGRGISLALAEEGCSVVVSDINQDDCLHVADEIKAMNMESVAIKCDVSQKQEVEKMIAETVKKFGKLDILVNNAGIYPYASFMEMKEEDWDKIINVNLKSVFLCSQAAAKKMEQGGKIVNVSSIAAFVGFPGLTHYCASKGGINAMTRTMALELALKKINVNTVAPGAIETPGVSHGLTEEIKKQIIAGIPWGRMGKPEDIAATVAFLASDKADYITGQTIIVDGGYVLR